MVCDGTCLMPKSLFDHPSYGPLAKAADLLFYAHKYTEAPGAMLMLIENAQVNLKSGIEMLGERDPLKQKMAFVCVVLHDSTQIIEKEIDGQKFQIPTVVDMDKFRWGILDLHKMVNEFRAQV